jgi:hypothetical protein
MIGVHRIGTGCIHLKAHVDHRVTHRADPPCEKCGLACNVCIAGLVCYCLHPLEG